MSWICQDAIVSCVLTMLMMTTSVTLSHHGECVNARVTIHDNIRYSREYFNDCLAVTCFSYYFDLAHPTDFFDVHENE